MWHFTDGDHDRASQNVSVRALSNAITNHDFVTAEHILNSPTYCMSQSSATTSMLQTVLHRCAKMGNIVGTTWCATKLACLGIPLNTLTFNAIIAACSKSGNVKKAVEWWERLLSEGVSPNNITYNTMIHTCAVAGDLQSAVYWMTQLLNSEAEPCKISFAAIISSFAKVGRLSEAEMWYQKMVELQICPDTVIFNTLICACAKGGKLNRAEHWLAEMEASNLYPDQKTFNNLINIAAKAGNLQKAISLYQSMLHSGEVPDMYTYGSILNACANVADLASAEDVMREMWDRGLQPNLVCYNTIITCCANCNDAERAISWYNHLRRQGLSGKTNTMKSLLNACVNANRKDLVEYVLETMILCGLPPDRNSMSKLECLVDKRNPLSSEWPYFVVLKACIRAQSCVELKRWLSQSKTLSDTYAYELLSYAYDLGGSNQITEILTASLSPRQDLHPTTMSYHPVNDTSFIRSSLVHEESFHVQRKHVQKWPFCDDDMRHQKCGYSERNMHWHEKSTPFADCYLELKLGSPCAGVENYSVPSTECHDLEEYPDLKSYPSSQNPSTSELPPAERVTSAGLIGSPPGLELADSALTDNIVPPECPPDVPLSWLSA
eukprot:TRINITY_DN8711_c0_g1_i4.p1 TRINITY_DN8711_c0_g1~~TRINITY_DN8711_c0_g1_i4.p1  ORF type:complete len:608 (+),score=68.09 TRINITY_DN8711_c0_g1_i4:69-1892(+)